MKRFNYIKWKAEVLPFLLKEQSTGSYYDCCSFCADYGPGGPLEGQPSTPPSGCMDSMCTSTLSHCTGSANTGSFNTGSFNTGSFNTGSFNTGSVAPRRAPMRPATSRRKPDMKARREDPRDIEKRRER